MLDFLFFKVIYPIFWKQIDSILDNYRLAQILSVNNTKEGLVYVSINKSYDVGTELLLYASGAHIIDPDSKEFLGALETVYGTARVVDRCVNLPDCSVALMTRINKKLEAGLLVKSVSSLESVFRTFKERKWVK